MNDLDLAALLVSRVCHDLVSPVGAISNGLEVLEEETDAVMRAEALRLITSSAEQAAARLQFARIAFGAAGSAGDELDLSLIARITQGLLRGGKVELIWRPHAVNWPKDWAKLLMNTIMMASDCLFRGGKVSVETSGEGQAPSFQIVASGVNARLGQEAQRGLSGEPGGALDGRTIQPYLTFRLAQGLGATLTTASGEGEVRFQAA